MNQKTLFALWGGLYALCAGLGFIPAPAGVLKALLAVLAVAFFVPPLMIVYGKSNRHTLQLVRNLAAWWLVLTTTLLVINFMSAAAPVHLGDLLYAVLVIVSSPMICGQYWVLSLFGWAFVMFAAMAQLKKK
jgi:hypothetical protein